MPADYRDDEILIDEITMDIRVFAYAAQEVSRCAAKVDEIMTSLKYRRKMIYDQDGPEFRMKVMRYIIYM